VQKPQTFILWTNAATIATVDCNLNPAYQVLKTGLQVSATAICRINHIYPYFSAISKDHNKTATVAATTM